MTGNYFKRLLKRERMQTVYVVRRQRLLNRLKKAKRAADA